MDDDQLSLPVIYKGKEFSFPLKIVPQGYVYRFVLQIDEVEVIFEKDEEGAFRAIISKPDEHQGKLPERGLLEAISEVIISLTS